MSINSLLRLTIENGGGTFDRNLESVAPETGFAVGMVDGTHTILHLEDLESLDHSVMAILIQFPAAFVGTWLNDGKIHLDPVIIVQNRTDAIEMARKFNQKAIYNFSTGETINV